jgi:pilus assembly protein CpaB
MGRRTLLLIASILIAALGTALIWLYVQGADTRAEQGTDLIPVLFLGQGAEAGADAAALRLISKKVPADVAAGAVRAGTPLTGQKMTTAATAGQILLTNMLSTEEVSRFPNGGAVSITISDPNRVPADLRVGDYVDVYAYGTGRAPHRVVQRIRVRTIGLQGGSGAATGQVPVTIIGFDATAAQAQQLYDIQAGGEQPALYDTGAAPPSPS